MIIEQIRYFVSADARDALLELRRQIDAIRRDQGVPGGKILLADEGSDDAPEIVWQCGYADEAELGLAETRLIGNPAYEEVRGRLRDLGTRVVLELYTVDETD
jgi:hypothetical protein